MEYGSLIHDWNVAEFDTLAWGRHVELNDETLRDGLQSPSATDPPIDAKIRLLHLMEELGIHAATIGLPAAGPRAVTDVTLLCEEIRDSRLAIQPNCAARTVLADVEPIARIAERTGVAFGGLGIHRQLADPPLCRGMDAGRHAEDGRGVRVFLRQRGACRSSLLPKIPRGPTALPLRRSTGGPSSGEPGGSACATPWATLRPPAFAR